ncbi:signal recognition particle-docking protein FtsY [Massilia sp. W12]|uniref:signal recognition particle-docking protein FtsY n=1 Tax=Massilia sp. W12 TaxID=3126507 RepID=UPI0030D381A4
MFSFFKKKPADAAPAPALENQPTDTAATPPLTLPAETSQQTAPAAPLDAPAPALASALPVSAEVLSPPPAVLPLEQEQAFAPGIAYGDLSASSTETVAPPPNPAEGKRSWLARLKAGLAKTSANLSLLFLGAKIDDDLYEELEGALLMSDAGVEATQYLLDALKKKVKDEKLTEAAQVKVALKTLLTELLQPLQKPFVLGRNQPLVMMIAGVNGAGKTTTIGKLAKHMQAHGQSVLLAAGDTFRAAAREQLSIWGQRNNVTVIAQESGDPAAVAFDAVSAGRARKMDVVMVDTAGRLPTQLHLMEELKKIKRVLGKAQDGAPHEVLLVIDGNTGQNALAQVKAFDDALQLSGLVITKLDGTAKGGVLAAIARTRPVPVYFIGVGEKIEDLQAFNAAEFVDALLG